ncbi:MAG: hypothetical protein NZ581_02210 [Candidatus Caldarchaeum sp.]|nr:hypothetical protein [Candidatus Caldarchaeum sp.]MDW8434999.1 hypothetical protein [Candidatus Caldarchaeum sp.]
MSALDSVLEEKNTEAVMYLPSKKTPEYFVLVSKQRQAVKLLKDERFRVYLVDKSAFVDDVFKASYAEVLAHRLLLPFKALKGEGLLQQLEKSYKREIVFQLVKDLVAEHKVAAVNLVIEPRYFLHEKIRRLMEVLPMMRSDLAEALAEDENVLRGFEEAASAYVDEGLLVKVDEGFSPTHEAVSRLNKIPVLGIPEQLRRLNIIKASKVFSLLMFEMVFERPSQQSFLEDPEQFVYLRTARGLQALSKQLDMMEFVREFFGGEARIRRIGGLFNSTYVIEVDSTKLFAKRYLSWTDVKWIAARIWTAWVKGFSIDPATRLAKEIYFRDYLRNHGFNTSEVVHVNWRDKILYTNYIEGRSLLESWLEKSADRHVFAEKTGQLLARIHDAGVRLGDCKPESFIRAEDGRMFVTDLEQSSFDGDPAWDLMELIFYPGHYLEADEAAALAEQITEGYLEVGKPEVVKKSLKPGYVRTMSLWTPPWVQIAVVDRVKQVLRA